MAIARLLRADIVCNTEDDALLVRELEGSRLLHIEDIHHDLDKEVAKIEEDPEFDSPEDEAVIQKAKAVLDFFSRYDLVKKGLLENFFGSAPFVEEQSFAEIYRRENFAAYESRLLKIGAEIEAIAARIEKAQEIEGLLLPWSALPEALSSVVRMRHASPIPLLAPLAVLPALLKKRDESGAAEDAQWVEISRDEKKAAGILFVVPERYAEAAEWLKPLGLEKVQLPDLEEAPAEAIRRISGEIEELAARKSELEETICKEAQEKRPVVQAVYDEHVNRKKNLLVKKNMFFTKNVLVVSGWVLERDRPRLEQLLSEKLPGSEVAFRAPRKGESPPVRLENHNLLRPFQTLLEMFGLPPYFGIDPTWFVAIAMTVFYSICLGDAGYGALQILITILLMRKFRPAEGTRLFLTMFTELGVGTMIFGILTWSFFGMSPGYTQGGPKILGFLPILSPTTDILTIIAVAGAIGAVFQLTSILMAFYASLKNQDLAGALFDKLSWFILLVGVLLWAATKFISTLPGAVGIASLVLMGAGGITILVFAGRESKGIGGRIMTGVISFYGIVGYYGVVSFFGDVLSYLRLAILNLTGSFISFVANLIGNLLMGKGAVLFVIISMIIALLPMLLFHLLNLVLSMMGAFVHSLRLNYLESFSRYYGSGGKAFSPFKKEGHYYRFEK